MYINKKISMTEKWFCRKPWTLNPPLSVAYPRWNEVWLKIKHYDKVASYEADSGPTGGGAEGEAVPVLCPCCVLAAAWTPSLSLTNTQCWMKPLRYTASKKRRIVPQCWTVIFLSFFISVCYAAAIRKLKCPLFARFRIILKHCTP